MSFNTTKNKLEKLWNQNKENEKVIITHKDNNTFIIDNVNILNTKNTTSSILANFSSDWLIPTTLLFTPDGGIEDIVGGNFVDYKLIFNDIDSSFIPYIHCEIIYRIGTSGIIPLIPNPFVPNQPIPFDEELALGGFGFENRLVTNEIFQINETNIEYNAFMRMDFFQENPQEVEYKFICYILNPHYYQST